MIIPIKILSVSNPYLIIFSNNNNTTKRIEHSLIVLCTHTLSIIDSINMTHMKILRINNKSVINKMY